MPAEFRLAPEVEAIARDIISKNTKHDHLRGARILYLFRSGTWMSKGKVVFGQAKKLTGELLFVARQLLIHQIGEGKEPDNTFADENGDIQYDFAVEINRNFWPKLNDLQRRAIIDHELCHCIREQDTWKISGHDIEGIFGSNVREYGLYMEDLKVLGKVVRAASDQLTLEDLTARQLADALEVPAGIEGVTVDLHGEQAEVTRRARQVS